MGRRSATPVHSGAGESEDRARGPRVCRIVASVRPAAGGSEQPRQSRVGSVPPDGPGPVSETGRYTRGTGVVTPLEAMPALIRWMWAGSGAHSPQGGELLVGIARLGWGATVKVYGVAVATPQG
jgi:hypothetical protein